MVQSRRDHLHAYRFATGRLASALVSGDPGRGEHPLRRSSLGTTFGAISAVLLAAGFGVFGLLSPTTKTTWRQPGSIVVEKESGNRYLFFGGQLHPVANYASALLAEGDRATVRTVSRDALAGVRHGAPVGIPGAPDSVPATDQLLSGAWTRCVRPGGTGRETVDFDPTTRVAPVTSGQWVLLVRPSGGEYVLWNGTKYPVAGKSGQVALGLDTQQSVTVLADWLANVPSGTRLAPARIPSAGSPGARVAGRPARIGALFKSAVGGRDHHYILLSDGLAPISATESALLSADRGGARPRQVSQSDIAAAPASSNRSLLHRIPDVLGAPPFPLGRVAVCLEQRSAGTSTTSRVAVESGPAAADGGSVLVPAGRGVLAVTREDLASRVATPRAYLITDRGIKYPLADDATASALGYGSAKRLTLPQQVLDLVRTGPRLSRAIATTPMPGE